MINLIYFVGDEKHCRPIFTLDDYIRACNTEEMEPVPPDG